MKMKTKLTEAQISTLTHALHVAASRFTEDASALRAAKMPRMAEQFDHQVNQSRQLAELLEEAESIELSFAVGAPLLTQATPCQQQQGKAPTGPFTAHVRTYFPKRDRPDRVYTMTRQTLKAAENYLDSFSTHVVAKWITNAEGYVHTRSACGDPMAVEQQGNAGAERALSDFVQCLDPEPDARAVAPGIVLRSCFLCCFDLTPGCAICAGRGYVVTEEGGAA